MSLGRGKVGREKVEEGKGDGFRGPDSVDPDFRTGSGVFTTCNFIQGLPITPIVGPYGGYLSDSDQHAQGCCVSHVLG